MKHIPLALACLTLDVGCRSFPTPLQAQGLYKPQTILPPAHSASHPSSQALSRALLQQARASLPQGKAQGPYRPAPTRYPSAAGSPLRLYMGILQPPTHLQCPRATALQHQLRALQRRGRARPSLMASQPSSRMHSCRPHTAGTCASHFLVPSQMLPMNRATMAPTSLIRTRWPRTPCGHLLTRRIMCSHRCAIPAKHMASAAGASRLLWLTAGHHAQMSSLSTPWPCRRPLAADASYRSWIYCDAASRKMQSPCSQLLRLLLFLFAAH